MRELIEMTKKAIDDILEYYRAPVAYEKIIHLLASAKTVLPPEGFTEVLLHLIVKIKIKGGRRG